MTYCDRMPSRRRGSLLACTGLPAAVLATVLTGCGGGQRAATPTVTTAVTAVADPASAAPGSVVDGRELARMIQSAIGPNATVTVQFSGGGPASTRSSAATGQVRMGTDFGMRMSVNRGKGSMTMLLISEGYFLSTGASVDGRTWIRLYDSTNDPVSQMLGSIMEEARHNVDIATLQSYLVLADSVVADGPSTVNGLRANKYTLKLGEKALRAQLPATMMTGLVDSEMNGASGAMTLYLDARNRPIQSVTTTNIKGQKVTGTATFSNWGGRADLTAPQPAQVLDLSSNSDVNKLSQFLDRAAG